MNKICVRCKIERPLSDFYAEKRASDGKRSECKFCTKIVNDRAYENITDERKQYIKEWNQSHKDRWPQYVKRWYDKHPGYIQEQSRKYKEAHPEQVKAKNKKYWQENKEYHRQLERKYRARKKQATIENVNEKGWLIIVQAYQSRCAYCAVYCEVPTMDHIIPLSKGGSHSYGNIIPACLRCNCRKGSRTPEQAGMPIIIEPLPFSIPQ